MPLVGAPKGSQSMNVQTAKSVIGGPTYDVRAPATENPGSTTGSYYKKDAVVNALLPEPGRGDLALL